MGFFPFIYVKWKRAIHWFSNLLWYWWVKYGCCAKINWGQYLILYPLWHNQTQSDQSYVITLPSHPWLRCRNNSIRNACGRAAQPASCCIAVHPIWCTVLVNFSRFAAIKYKSFIGDQHYIETWGRAKTQAFTFQIIFSYKNLNFKNKVKQYLL